MIIPQTLVIINSEGIANKRCVMHTKHLLEVRGGSKNHEDMMWCAKTIVFCIVEVDHHDQRCLTIWSLSEKFATIEWIFKKMEISEVIKIRIKTCICTDG